MISPPSLPLIQLPLYVSYVYVSGAKHDLLHQYKMVVKIFLGASLI